MKKHIKIIIPAVLLGLISIVYFATNGFNTRPFKVIDPFDSRFNAQEFRFEDYKNEDELANALKTLFAIGTLKVEVEKILVTANGLSPRRYEDPELKYPLSGHGGIPRSEYTDYKQRIQSVHRAAHETVLYQKLKKTKFSPASWNVYVFYNKDKEVIQIMLTDLLMLPARETR